MKSISASIIVVAGLAMIYAAANHHHSDTGMFLTAVDIVTAVIGLAGWLKTIRKDDH